MARELSSLCSAGLGGLEKIGGLGFWCISSAVVISRLLTEATCGQARHAVTAPQQRKALDHNFLYFFFIKKKKRWQGLGKGPLWRPRLALLALGRALSEAHGSLQQVGDSSSGAARWKERPTAGRNARAVKHSTSPLALLRQLWCRILSRTEHVQRGGAPSRRVV